MFDIGFFEILLIGIIALPGSLVEFILLKIIPPVLIIFKSLMLKFLSINHKYPEAEDY